MPKKILVADNSITIQKVFSFTFKGPDYAITAVGDAAAALTKAKEIIPDLIVVDLSLPQKNGYEVFQEIRRNAQLQKAVGLILVGAKETFNPEKAKQVGVFDFLIKPFDTQALTNKVKELLSRPPKTIEAVPGAKDLPPLTMADEPSLIRFTRATLQEKPKAPEPAAAVSDTIQVVDQDLEPESVDFDEVEALEPESEPASPKPETVAEIESLDQIDLEPAELEEQKPADPGAAEPELEEIVLEDELAHDPEPEELELEPLEPEPLETEATETSMDDIVFDVVSDGSASHFEAKPKKPAPPAHPDLSALEDLPMAEAEEVEGLPELAEVPPMEELGPETAPETLEEVPPEIPYAEAVEEELEMGIEPDAVEPELEQVELEPDLKREEARPQGFNLESPDLEAEEEEIELEPGPVPAEMPEPASAAGTGMEAESEQLEMGSEPEAAPDGQDLSGSVPTSLEDQMPEDGFITVDDSEIAKSAPAAKPAGPRKPEAGAEEVNRLAAETFEKVAWEVIPDLVDRLVREMIKERIEKVAWEVVPDLAERLIQEEIKKLETRAGEE